MNTARVVLLFWVSFVFAAAGAPVNNAFGKRTLLTGTETSRTGSNIGATAQPGEPAHAGYPARVSVWWTWTAPFSGNASFEVTKTSFYRPLMACYRGTTLSNLVRVASKVGGSDNTLRFSAVGGQKYHIAVDESHGYTSTFAIRLALSPGPANDNFTKRAAIEGTGAQLMACFVTATTEAGEPSHRGSGTNNGSVWWTWTAPTNGILYVENVNRIAGPALALYTGTNLSSLAAVARTASETLTVGVTGGMTYQLVADSAPPNTYAFPSLVLLNLAFCPYPANDAFRNRIALGSSINTVYGNNIGATSEASEPYHAGFTPQRSIWWTWTAPSNGRLTLRSSQSEMQTVLGVYVGTNVSQLQQAPAMTRWSKDRLDIVASAGVNYQIAVDSKDGAGGVVLEFERWQGGPSNDYFSNRVTLAGTGLTVTGTLQYASKEVGEPHYTLGAGGRSVWYSWTAPERGILSLSAGRSGLDPNISPIVSPVLAIYRGTAVSSLSPVGGATGGPPDPTLARCKLQVEAGESYIIAVDDENLSSDGFVLTLSFAPAPVNDLITNRILLRGVNWMITGSTYGASTEWFERFSYVGSTVWYTWTPGVSGMVTLTITGSFDTVLLVYQGQAPDNLTEVAVNDDYVVGSSGSRVTLPGQGSYVIGIGGGWGDYTFWATHQSPPVGVTLLYPQTNMVFTAGSHLTLSAEASDEDGDIVAVEFRNGTDLLATVRQPPWTAILTNASPGRYSITATAIDNDGNQTSSDAVPVRVCPINDDFADRIVFPSGTNIVFGEIAGANEEPGEPSMFNQFFNSVWWTWTPLTDTNVVFVSELENFNTYIDVYCGDSIEGIAEILQSSESNRVTFHAQSGISYAIRVRSRSECWGLVSLRLMAAPANDDFANRIALNGATNWLLVSNLDASAEPGEPAHIWVPEKSLWWSFKVPQAGTACLVSHGRGSTTGLAAYRGENLTNLVRVASGYNWSATSKIVFPVAAGTNYAIAVDSSHGQEIEISMSFTPLPTNDNLAQATLLEGPVGRFSGHNFGATKEAGEPNHAGYPGGRSVWYNWTAPASGFLSLSNVGCDFKILLAAYRSTNAGKWSVVASNSNFATSSVVKFFVTKGGKYNIAVDGYTNAMGFFTLDWSFLALPGNDLFTNRVALSGYTGVPGYNFWATNEPGEPKHGYFADGRSVWYEWTAPEDASVSVAVTETSAGLAIYTGTSVSKLTLIAKSDDLDGTKVLTFRAVAGTSYAFAVDSTGTRPGYFSLTVFPNEAPQVSVTSPASNTVFSLGESIPATAAAFDPDGWITNLVLSLGSQSVQLAGPPYEHVWSGIPLGRYSLKATATDNLGAKMTSTSVEIHIRPVNDSFMRSLPLLTAAPASSISTNASKEPGEPNHAGKPGGASLWWFWTAPENGRYCLTTRGSTVDTLLAVYKGTDVSNLSLVASNDNANASVGYSELNFQAEASVTYQIVVDGGNAAQGMVQLAINPSPSNDSFENGTQASSLFTAYHGSNVNAGRDPGEPWHALRFGSKSLWWAWTAPHTGSFTFSTKGSSIDTVLALYSGTELTNLTALASNDDSDGLTTSRVQLKAVAGTEYKIAIDGYGDSSGDVQLRIFPNNPPGLAPLQVIGNQTIINFSGQSGVTNTLEMSTDLAQWGPVGWMKLTNPEGLGVFTNGFSPAIPAHYYRVRLP